MTEQATRTGPHEAESYAAWMEAIDWLINSRHCADPDIQEVFWGLVDGKLTREEANVS